MPHRFCFNTGNRIALVAIQNHIKNLMIFAKFLAVICLMICCFYVNWQGIEPVSYKCKCKRQRPSLTLLAEIQTKLAGNSNPFLHDFGQHPSINAVKKQINDLAINQKYDRTLKLYKKATKIASLRENLLMRTIAYYFWQFLIKPAKIVISIFFTDTKFISANCHNRLTAW